MKNNPTKRKPARFMNDKEYVKLLRFCADCISDEILVYPFEYFLRNPHVTLKTLGKDPAKVNR